MPRPNIPPGFCHCGCGEKTPPRNFCPGHSKRGLFRADRWRERVRFLANGCWEWTGHVNAGGYGTIKDRGKILKAHRFVYEQTKGPIPGGLPLDHLCEYKQCVNPDHLEPVPTKTNVRRGKRSKLTVRSAAEIRALYEGGARQVDLAETFGVTPSCIQAVVAGRTWR